MAVLARPMAPTLSPSTTTGSQSRERTKSVLLVFLRPVIIRDAQTSNSLALDRYESIRAQQQAQQPEPRALMPISDSPVLPAVPPRASRCP